MNIDQANAIDLTSILNKMGVEPAKQKGNELWYLSPLRTEKTPSFHVHASKNIWYDFGEAKGGKVIDLICAYLQSRNEDYTIVDALRWLNNMHASKPLELFSREEAVDYGMTLELRKVSTLQNPSFVNYLNSRGVPLAYAKKYLKEVYVSNNKSGKSFLALGLPNENGGYELRNKFFKGCIAPKSISFIRGATFLPEEIHVFEGFMDYLSALTQQSASRFNGDVIILNSVSCLEQAFPYIKNYSYKKLHTWLDNDVAGNKASLALKEFAKAERNLFFKPMNETYAAHKDVNAWHMHNLGLKS